MSDRPLSTPQNLNLNLNPMKNVLPILLLALILGACGGESSEQTEPAESEATGIWTLQSSVFPENRATRRLHAEFGFREVGYRERIGLHHGAWRDTLLLERRSRVAGM